MGYHELKRHIRPEDDMTLERKDNGNVIISSKSFVKTAGIPAKAYNSGYMLYDHEESGDVIPTRISEYKEVDYDVNNDLKTYYGEKDNLKLKFEKHDEVFDLLVKYIPSGIISKNEKLNRVYSFKTDQKISSFWDESFMRQLGSLSCYIDLDESKSNYYSYSVFYCWVDG